tara:strand:- start:1382 stop:1675 length:294 start_codon:yes stop_codon:yes gene_type:complete
MGMISHEHDNSMLLEKTKNGNEVIYLEDLKYHKSWDWLMPVVVECFNKQEKVSDDLSFKLNDALLETNNESLYRIVVEFIKTYNDEIKQIEINTINT